MHRSGGRLNLTGALNRNMPPTVLNALTSEPDSKQASVCRLERELKAVKEENNRLRYHLEETRSALKELTSEASLEKFDERRVNLLKMQIIQLQRQVLLMSEALGSRSTVLMEVENALTWLSEKFRHYIGMDVKGAEVPVLRSDFITMVDTSESARIKLFKNVENCSKENLSHPQMLMNSFLKPGMEKEFTTLDSCLGRFDCLNLKHVAQLESKLSRLYKELIKVSEYLNGRAGSEQDQASEGHVSGAVREREGTVILRACAMSRECAADLLSLSLLFPSAPWPPLKKPTMAEVTYEALAPALPTMPRSKAAVVQQCVTAALKACNHRCYMVGQEAGALREEVRFHQAVYQLQLEYVQQVFESLRQGYGEFEHSTNKLLIQPMKKLLEAYRMLRNNTSHEGLKEFLTILKQQEHQWTDIIQKLDVTDPQNQSGAVVLSAFGEEFMASLDRLVMARQRQRDKANSQKEELKAAQQQLEQELRAIISDRDEQQKIAKEMKSKDFKIDADAGDDAKVELEMPALSHRSSSQILQPCDESEVITGLRPWLDSPQASMQSDGKKGKKPQTGSMTNRKPWQDGGEGASQGEADASVLPWSDRSRSNSRNEGKETRNETITGLRPWLDEQTEENQEKNCASARRRESRELPSRGENSDRPLEGDVRQSPYDWSNSSDSVHQDGTDSEKSGRLPLLPSDRRREPSNMGQNTNQLQSDGGIVSARPYPNTMKPSVPTDLSVRRPPARTDKEKIKRQTKPRNYEPKLYVANRTLSLRRSGSLSRLAEPSLQDQMSKMTASSRHALENSRTKADPSSK